MKILTELEQLEKIKDEVTESINFLERESEDLWNNLQKWQRAWIKDREKILIGEYRMRQLAKATGHLLFHRSDIFDRIKEIKENKPA